MHSVISYVFIWIDMKHTANYPDYQAVV